MAGHAPWPPSTRPTRWSPAGSPRGVIAEGDRYLVLERAAGRSLRDTGCTQAIAEALGRQLRRVHALDAPGVPTIDDWGPLDIGSAAAESSLPAPLAAQADAYVRRLPPGRPVFVHGDLCAAHVFVDGGKPRLIDWGDAVIADPHYELIQLFRDAFDCDRSLLRAFLRAYRWPVHEDFAHRALSCALTRQAVGLQQHRSMDVFEPIAARFPPEDVATLDELAHLLFATDVES